MTPWSCRENCLKDNVNFKIYDVITLTNNYNTHIVQYAQRIQIPLRSCFWITGTSQNILPRQLVWVFTLSGSFMSTGEDPCRDSLQWSAWTERPISRLHLRMNFFGLFPTYSLTAFILRRVLALSLLSHLGVSGFLLSLSLVLWLEIYVSIHKFGFSGDGCWSWSYGEILLEIFDFLSK